MKLLTTLIASLTLSTSVISSTIVINNTEMESVIIQDIKYNRLSDNYVLVIKHSDWGTRCYQTVPHSEINGTDMTHVRNNMNVGYQRDSDGYDVLWIPQEVPQMIYTKSQVCKTLIIM